MKILILSKKFPYPLKEGEPIAIAYLSRSLRAKDCELDLLVLNTSKHFFDPAGLPEAHNFYRNVYSVKVDNQITWGGALMSMVRGESYILSRFKSAAYAQKLKEVLSANTYDVVQLETVYMAHYIPIIHQFSTAVIAMRAHNVEHEIWQRYAETAPNIFKKWYLRYQNKSLQEFEVARLGEYDLLVAITGRDLEVFKKMGFRHDAVVAPVGMDLSGYEPDLQCFKSKIISLAFIGALDWMPNQGGVVWFLDHVWPVISVKYPTLQLHLAGKNTPDWLHRKAGERVVVHGEVEDAKRFINDHPILIAPLFSGSGIKIKVLEGMALSRVVITTPIGLEGIPAKSGEQLLVAGTADEFIQQIDFCMKNPLLLQEMGTQARQFIHQHFDHLTIGGAVCKAYKNSVEKKQNPAFVFSPKPAPPDHTH